MSARNFPRRGLAGGSTHVTSSWLAVGGRASGEPRFDVFRRRLSRASYRTNRWPGLTSLAKRTSAAAKLARILEKQNRLQMSQVFPFSCIDDQMGVAFQDSIARPLHPSDAAPTWALLTARPRRSEARPRWTLTVYE